jgi:hypothetical protein
MTRLIKDKNGSAHLWAIFILLAMVMLTVVIYNGVTVYTKYQSAETALQRAVTVTVDGSLKNAAVRDLILDVPATGEELLFDHLRELGYDRDGVNWTKRVDGKTVYTLTSLAVETDGRTMEIDAVLAIPLLWETDSAAVVRIPIQAQSSILYIE